MIPVYHKKISDGIHDIASYMGLSPHKTLFLHSTNTDPIERYSAHRNLYDHTRLLGILPKKDMSKVKGVILFSSSSLLHYLHEVGVADRESYLNLDMPPKSFKYPDISLAYQFKKYCIRENLLLHGKQVVISSLDSNATFLEKELGVTLPMDVYAQARLDSKIKLREHASEYQYKIPIGVTCTVDSFEEDWRRFCDSCQQVKIKNHAYIWVKHDDQSSATGSKRLVFNQQTPNKVLEIVRTYQQRMFSTRFGGGTIKHYEPFIIELDISALVDEQYVANVGFSAVVSEKEITIVGVTGQQVNDGHFSGNRGRYIGSYYCEKLEELSTQLQHSPMVFYYLQQSGYRGFVTVDTLISKDKLGNLIFRHIDPNIRFSNSTMLLSMLHHVEREIGIPHYGMSYMNQIKQSDNAFELLLQIIGDSLYRGVASNYCGILPIDFQDTTAKKTSVIYFQTIVIAPSYRQAEKIYASFLKRLTEHNGQVYGTFNHYIDPWTVNDEN